MQPPILQWKVYLALIGFVIAAVILGSVLHSTSDKGRQVGGWTHYGSVSIYDSIGNVSPQLRRHECRGLKKMASRATGPFRREMKRSARQVCRALR